MQRQCYIAGTGLVTTQGVGVQANWRALLAGNVLHETGIVPVDRDWTLPRVSQLAILAAEEALAAASHPDLTDGRTALVIGTSKGPVEDWIDQLNGKRPPSIGNGLAQVAVDVAARTGHAAGPRLTLGGACASGLHALVRAHDLIARGDCDQALVVAAEASTHALFRANFARLGVLADPAEGCRPFDPRRHGFLLAEAAAAVWLTSDPPANAIRIAGTSVAADATHVTGTDPHGRSLRHVLQAIDLPAIDFIHAHGTGTVLNDETEQAAITEILGRHHAKLYSHKHAIGHTQGAAGLIATVINVACHHGKVVPGNVNSRGAGAKRMENVGFSHAASAHLANQSVAIAAGFGGTLAGVSLWSEAAASV